MHAHSAAVERCPDTGLCAGHVPGFAGAHRQGETLEELNHNLEEVIALILDHGPRSGPRDESAETNTASPR